MDTYRPGDRFVVHFDLPGVDPRSIDLTVEQNTLRVSATREWPRDEGAEVVAAERPQGTFTRQLLLGDSLDSDHVEASYDDGVLTVVVPVADRAKARRVEITSAAGARELESSAIAT
jgi:HSP20 family protein